jgi:hypothetical protein
VPIAGQGKAVPESRGDRGDSYPSQRRSRQRSDVHGNLLEDYTAISHLAEAIVTPGIDVSITGQRQAVAKTGGNGRDSYRGEGRTGQRSNVHRRGSTEFATVIAEFVCEIVAPVVDVAVAGEHHAESTALATLGGDGSGHDTSRQVQLWGDVDGGGLVAGIGAIAELSLIGAPGIEVAGACERQTIVSDKSRSTRCYRGNIKTREGRAGKGGNVLRRVAEGAGLPVTQFAMEIVAPGEEMAIAGAGQANAIRTVRAKATGGKGGDGGAGQG